MPFEAINPSQFPKPIAPYSAGAKADNVVYVSGTLALGEGGTVLHPGNAGAQARHVREVIRTTIEAARGTMADVVTNMAMLPEEDRSAIAAYVKSLPPRPTPPEVRQR